MKRPLKIIVQVTVSLTPSWQATFPHSPRSSSCCWPAVPDQQPCPPHRRDGHGAAAPAQGATLLHGVAVQQSITAAAKAKHQPHPAPWWAAWPTLAGFQCCSISASTFSLNIRFTQGLFRDFLTVSLSNNMLWTGEWQGCVYSVGQSAFSWGL